VLGCQALDPAVALRGVILNQVGGVRHERILREVIADCCGLPVLGAIPHLPEDPFPARHLGLVPPEHSRDEQVVAQAAAHARRYLRLDALADIARTAPPLSFEPAHHWVRPAPEGSPRIGVCHDEAFTFYYPENLQALRAAGARLIDVSPLHDDQLPEVDALYLGGGFPEVLAEPLAANIAFRASVRAAVSAGLPVYAECGGAVYLGEQLQYCERSYPMAGVFPVTYAFDRRPRGHGYAELEAIGDNPFFAPGTVLRGHEFHYTYAAEVRGPVSYAFRLRRGHGFDGEHDGMCARNVLATYTHLHALSVPEWAHHVVAAARRFSAAGATTQVPC